MTDWQGILNFVFISASGVAGWLFRTLYSAVMELREDLSELREHIPTTYISKADMGSFKSELFHRLDRIESKIDGKQDK